MKISISKIKFTLLSYVITFWLSWRLIRNTDFLYQYWYFYVYVLLILILLTIHINLTFFVNLFHNFFKNNHIKNYQYIFLFISCLMVLFIYHTISNFSLDTFGIASLVFFLFFPFTKFFGKLHPEIFFKIFEKILVLLIFLILLDTFNLFFDLNIFDYSLIENLREDPNIATINTHHSILNLRGRGPGVSGTVYASSALVAAASVYFFIIKSYWKIFLAGFTLFIQNTGSVILPLLFISFFLINKKNFIFLFLICFIFILFIIEKLGLKGVSIWLPKFVFHGTEFQFASSFLLGEGKHIPSVTFGEIRGLALIFSFGLFGSVLLITIFFIYLKSLKLFFQDKHYLNYKGSLYFIIILLLSSWHYPTFMVFPNIVFVIALIAFLSSRLRLKHLNKKI